MTLQLHHQITNITLLFNLHRLVIKLLLVCLLVKVMIINSESLLAYLELESFFIIKKVE